MAVDLGDYVEAVKAEVSAPGEDILPNATDEQWIQAMSNAFWEARLEGFFVGYTETDGLITTIPAGGTDLGREHVQLIFLFTAYKAVRNKLLNLKTRFRGKAGPVETESERSAQVLTTIMKQIGDKLKELNTTLLAAGGTPTYYFDAVVARDEALGYYDDVDTWWP